ncbi:MAG: hypothetical protein GY913_12055 [Proteobacteria bacterium]|nr:hypothetical protein [Pseudomonadota bacterium]MCP4917649.1 hypothetical protein [Pseudomonadota bacterium]
MIHTEPRAPLEFCPVATGPAVLPEEYQNRVLIDVVHDGNVIPEEFLVDGEGRAIPQEEYLPRFIEERDWGAKLVAKQLALKLGLEGYYSVSIARVLMDFGRFPGITQGVAGHLRRSAINQPFAGHLGHEQRRDLLETWYDGISSAFDGRVRGRLVKLAIHTYDPTNNNGTPRPKVSLISRVAGFDHDSGVTHTAFDPLYPHILGEFTAHRVLRNRIGLTLERMGLGVGYDYPYLLPEGSLEVRAQVWTFFDWVGRRFTQAHHETLTEPAYHRVWEMLLDTNHRSMESAALRAYLHRYRRAPPSRAREFRAAQDAYDHVRSFIEADDGAIIEEFRFSPERPSFLGVEVRKDLVCEFDDQGRPVGPNEEGAELVARGVAEALLVYLREDR